MLVACKGKDMDIRTRSESESEQGVQFDAVDPKPGDLAMVRLKVE